MTPHRPEPWKAIEQAVPDWELSSSIRDKDDGTVVWPGAVGLMDARRIVACVNACAGLPTEWLEGLRTRQLAEWIVSENRGDENDVVLEQSQ